MLTEKYSVTVKDIELEIDDLHKRFLTARKFLNSQLRFLRDSAAGQGQMFASGPIAAGATIANTEAALKGLKDLYASRNRHLNAFLRILRDEAAEAAAKKQLPLLKAEGEAAT